MRQVLIRLTATPNVPKGDDLAVIFYFPSSSSASAEVDDSTSRFVESILWWRCSRFQCWCFEGEGDASQDTVSQLSSSP